MPSPARRGGVDRVDGGALWIPARACVADCCRQGPAVDGDGEVAKAASAATVAAAFNARA